ncbi:MAG: ATP synthase F1 subunit delta [Bacteroidales bacterium]|nr:ATP synthase F1 subunit delta [Bacteroidales bacterium]
MLQKSTIARRYASAILSLSKEFNVLEAVNADFKTLKPLLNESPEFHNFLSNPVVNAKQKIRVIEKIFGGTVQPLIIKLLDVLLRYDRGDIFEDIIDLFSELYIDEKGILPVKLTSAQPLDEKEKALLRQPLEELSHKTVEFEESIDESLIGGFIADFSVYRLDASISKSLDDFRKVLSKGSF